MSTPRYPDVGAFFSAHVNRWCDMHDMTRDTLCSAIDADPSWMSRLCSGQIRPDPRAPVMERLVRHLGLDAGERERALRVLGLELSVYLPGLP